MHLQRLHIAVEQRSDGEWPGGRPETGGGVRRDEGLIRYEANADIDGDHLLLVYRPGKHRPGSRRDESR